MGCTDWALILGRESPCLELGLWSMWAVGRDHHLNKNQSIARKVEMEAKWAATKVSTTTKTDCLIRWPYPCILWSVTTFGLWVLCLVWQREGEVMGRITSWEHGTLTRVTNWPGFPGMEWFPGMQDLRYQHWGNHKQTERLCLVMTSPNTILKRF